MPDSTNNGDRHSLQQRLHMARDDAHLEKRPSMDHKEDAEEASPPARRTIIASSPAMLPSIFLAMVLIVGYAHAAAECMCKNNK